MRCVDAVEELTASTGPASAALAEHLARCPRCADQARRATRLARLWEATRPEEPTPATWATVWAHVTQGVEATPVAPPALDASSPQLRPMAPSGRWRHRAWVSFGSVQAAAVLLLAAWLVWQRDVTRPPQPPGAATGPSLAQKPATPGPDQIAPDPSTALALATITATTMAPIEIDYGAPVRIESDRAVLKVVSLAMDEGPSAVDANFVMLNYFEAMAE